MFSAVFLSIFLLIVSVITFFWVFSTSTFNHWKKLGIPYLKPTPFFGNMTPILMMRQAVHETYDKLYRLIDEKPYGGYFEMRTPALVLKDPELVQRILVTDFRYFIDHGFVLFYANKKLNPLNENIFLSCGERWKALRKKISPVFSQAKLKGMQNQILDCLSTVIDFMEIGMTDEGKEVELKDVCLRFMIDVSGTCAFGIECNATKLKNEFLKFATELLIPRWSSMVKFFVGVINMKLVSVLKLTDFPSHSTKFFQNLVYDAVLYRRENNLKRSDLLQQLMDMQNEAVNPKFSVDCLKKSLSEDETLRKYPVVPLLSRECSEDYIIPETGLKLKRGDKVHIPVWSIHHDERYYPNPELFDPERFNDENKQSRPLGTYLPFGDGPRNCIGKKFSEMVMKMALSKMLILYHFTPCSKSEIPITYEKSPITVAAQNGLWVNITKRGRSSAV